jgi:parallel beta-helix repeat protein
MATRRIGLFRSLKSNLRFVLPVILILFLASGVGRLSGAVYFKGVITNDTTWTSADTIIVTGYVTVTETAKLTIEAGTTILFDYPYSMDVNGELAANGEHDSRIVFSSVADTTDGSPMAGRWQGVRLLDGSSGSFHYCDLRYATKNLYCDKAPLVFRHCVVENFSNFGTYLTGFGISSLVPALIDSCIVRQTASAQLGKGTGIYIYGSWDATVSYCSVSDCYDGVTFYASHEFAPSFQITGCEIRDNAYYGINMSYG